MQLDYETDFYDIDVVNANLMILENGIKDVETTVYSGTLTAVGWVGSVAPYTQTVAITGLPEDAGGDIGLPMSATDAQDKAARDARLRPIEPQPAGSVTVKATGKKPIIDIPIVISVRG
jgi:hypothetical protein